MNYITIEDMANEKPGEDHGVLLNGKLVGLVQEARAGYFGWITLLYREDWSVGSIESARSITIYGEVQILNLNYILDHLPKTEILDVKNEFALQEHIHSLYERKTFLDARTMPKGQLAAYRIVYNGKLLIGCVVAKEGRDGDPGYVLAFPSCCGSDDDIYYCKRTKRINRPRMVEGRVHIVSAAKAKELDLKETRIYLPHE